MPKEERHIFHHADPNRRPKLAAISSYQIVQAAIELCRSHDGVLDMDLFQQKGVDAAFQAFVKAESLLKDHYNSIPGED